MTATEVRGDEEETAAFLAELKAFEGQPVGAPTRAPDAVNQAMIRHWCEAVGDSNPVYLDPVAAAASVHGQIIAPPTMLQAWIMRGLRYQPPEGGSRSDELMELLNKHGFTSVVATNCEQDYVRDLHLGDHLTLTSTIESVSDEKQTALGAGHFVTNRLTYTDDDGEVVATMRFRILKFRPRRPPAEQAERPRRPRPAVTQDNAWWFEACRDHRLLIQRCSACGRLRHPPQPMCPACRSFDWDSVRASGHGSVYSFVVNHYPQVPAFDYPLVVALIELAEGTRLVANLTGVAPEDVEVGLPVELEFADFDDELSLPQFRPVRTPATA
jgi:uncharacterized OB-fold protein/acyl dehydratase